MECRGNLCGDLSLAVTGAGSEEQHSYHVCRGHKNGAGGKGCYAEIPGKQEEWDVKNIKMFSRDKCQVLHLGRKSSWQEHKLRTEGLGGAALQERP